MSSSVRREIQQVDTIEIQPVSCIKHNGQLHVLKDDIQSNTVERNTAVEYSCHVLPCIAPSRQLHAV